MPVFGQKQIIKSVFFFTHPQSPANCNRHSTADIYALYFVVLDISSHQFSSWLKTLHVVSCTDFHIYWFMHVSLDLLHLQEAVQGLGLHPHRAVLQPVVQVQVINS